MHLVFNHSKNLPANTGNIVYDPTKDLITITAHPSIKSVSVDQERVLKFFETHNKTEWNSLHEMIVTEIVMDKDYQTPCCSWFSPAAIHVKNGAEQVSNYPFMRNRKDGQCTNPIITNSKNGFVPCSYYNSYAGMETCDSFSESEYFNFIIGMTDGQEVFFVQKRYIKMREPVYRILDAVSGDVLYENLANYDKELEDVLALNNGCEIHTLVKPPVSYLKAVLA